MTIVPSGSAVAVGAPLSPGVVLDEADDTPAVAAAVPSASTHANAVTLLFTTRFFSIRSWPRARGRFGDRRHRCGRRHARVPVPFPPMSTCGSVTRRLTLLTLTTGSVKHLTASL